MLASRAGGTRRRLYYLHMQSHYRSWLPAVGAADISTASGVEQLGIFDIVDDINRPASVRLRY